MNKQLRKRGSRSRWELPNAPDPPPPTFKSVANEVTRRRQRKTRNSITAVVTLLCVGIGAGVWFRSQDRNLAPNEIAGHPRISPRDASVDLANDFSNERLTGKDLHNAPPDLSSFTFYANIRSDAPVFEFDKQRGVMVPIGWVRSTDTVPVDLGPLSSDEIETFRTFLHDEPQKHFF